MSIPRLTVARERPRTKLADDVELWRVAHRACLNHLKSCLDCGIELCPDGATLWRAADDAERELPWSRRP